MDDWIDVDSPAKRCRLSSDIPSPSKGGPTAASISDKSVVIPSFSSSSPANSSTACRTNAMTDRPECRYGANCYRRNENHLLQFRHELLERAYGQMEKLDNFASLPPGFDLEDGDEQVILDQVEVLKSAGFTLSPPTPSTTQLRDDSEEQSLPDKTPGTSDEKEKRHQSDPRPSTASVSNNSSLSQLFEERRQKMKRKELLSKTKAKVQEDRSQRSSEAVMNIISPYRIGGGGGASTMIEKLQKSAPFNVFLTKVRDIPEEKQDVLSASFLDLFDPSLGEVKALCHINYMIEASWFLNQMMEAGLTGKPMWIIHGEDNEELVEGAKAFSSIKLFRAKSPFPYGHHHTKMSFVQYTDLSVRFMVYTANLIESDWDNRTQGIWISPKCPRLPTGSPPTAGESSTKFRSDVLQYLSTYPVQASAAWKDVIKYADCSSIKVFFVASAPITTQSAFDGFQFGIKKMEKVLRSFELDTEPDWPLNAQCSSIGTLGSSAEDWLLTEFGGAMSGKDNCLRGHFNLVYPTEQNVRSSFDGVLGGGCLPYSAMTHMKQKWLYRHLFQWKADCSGRSRAPPHIKSYSRWSPDYSKMAWFLLTSANLSKAAWGKVNKQGNRLNLMSWEAGVLFIPALFNSSKYFSVTASDTDALRFPFYYDIPLIKYGQKDRPWFCEFLQLAISE